MRVLLDACVWGGAAAVLRAAGHDVEWVGDWSGDLLGYGVPVEWLDDVRAATEDTLLDRADRLPASIAGRKLQQRLGSLLTVPGPPCRLSFR